MTLSYWQAFWNIVSYSCAAVDEVPTDIWRRAVPLWWPSLLLDMRGQTDKHTHTHKQTNKQLQLTCIADASTLLARAVSTADCGFTGATHVLDLLHNLVHYALLLLRVAAGSVHCWFDVEDANLLHVVNDSIQRAGYDVHQLQRMTTFATSRYICTNTQVSLLRKYAKNGEILLLVSTGCIFGSLLPFVTFRKLFWKHLHNVHSLAACFNEWNWWSAFSWY